MDVYLTFRKNYSPISISFKNLSKIHKELETFKPPFHIVADSEKVKIDNEAKLLDYLFQHGKKGIVVQRYKGLGEMNAEQLWSTTMNPETRTVLKVSLEDAVQAENIFTILMGDQVAPRREFIQNHAPEVRFIDI